MSATGALQDLLALPSSAQGPVALWSGLDVPVEIIEAAGLWPRRLTGRPAAEPPDLEALSEGGGEPTMRAHMAEILTAGPETALLALGAAPVKGVWLYNLLLSLGAPQAFRAELVDIIHDPAPSAGRRNLLAVGRFAAALGVVEAGPLAEAVAARNGVRARLRRIEALRWGPAPRLRGADARAILDAAEQAPAARLQARLDQVLAAAAGASTVDGVPVIFSGAGGADLDLYEALEARGLRIVGDDQDFGSRAIGPDVSETVSPLEALATRYEARDPAPACWSRKARVAYLLAMARTRGAAAVLFDLPTTDHPASWDHPEQARALKDAGLHPVLLPRGAGAGDAAAFALSSLREAAGV